MCLAAAILTDQGILPALKDDSNYVSADIRYDEYKKLRYIRKTDILAYKYLVEDAGMLADHLAI